jgi:hypothetical protein
MKSRELSQAAQLSFRPSEATAGIHNPCADDLTLRVMDSGFARCASAPE